MPEVLDLLADVETAASRLPTTRDAVSGLTDDELMEAQRRMAAVDRRTDASAAVIAAEIGWRSRPELGWRSRPELGYAGLAQRTGARTPESLVQQLTGSTGREAATLVRVGNVMAEAELLPPSPQPGTDAGTDSGVDPALDGVPAPGPVEETPWDGTGTAWLTPVGRAVADGVLPVSAADAIHAGLGTLSETVTVGVLTDAARRLVEEAGRCMRISC